VLTLSEACRNSVDGFDVQLQRAERPRTASIELTILQPVHVRPTKGLFFCLAEIPFSADHVVSAVAEVVRAVVAAGLAVVCFSVVDGIGLTVAIVITHVVVTASISVNGVNTPALIAARSDERQPEGQHESEGDFVHLVHVTSPRPFYGGVVKGAILAPEVTS